MKNRFVYLAVILIISSIGVVYAQENGKALFVSVEGAVTVDQPTGVAVRARKDDTLRTTSKVATSARGRAVLLTLDGSTIEVGPNTAFILAAHHETTAGDKVVRFDLKFGELRVKAAKLSSDASAFEVIAGGVRCKGGDSEFEVFYNPQKERLRLKVSGGKVQTIHRKAVRELPEGSDVLFQKGIFRDLKKEGKNRLQKKAASQVK